MNRTQSITARLATMTALAVAVMAISSNADALVINFNGISGASGNPLSASASFTVSGSQLTIVLTNTMNSAAMNGADVLDGLYFDIAGGPVAMSNGQASLTAGSSMVKKNNVAAGSVNPFNNEWMFKAPNVVASRQFGIGCSGALGFGTNDDTFDEVFHGGSASASANDDYGLVPTAGITAGNNTNVYANNSMTFTFDLDRTISDSDIQNAYVSYGSNGQSIVTPEPASLAALAVGAIALLRRRNRK